MLENTPRGDWQAAHTDQHFTLRWPHPRPCLSTAIYHGGFHAASALLNLRVAKHTDDATVESPDVTLANWARELKIESAGKACIGMMTAASMNSLRCRHFSLYGQAASVYISSGLSNARRAGDPADWSESDAHRIGTINSVIICDAAMGQSTMAEILVLATEAKAAVLQELDIRSPVSQAIATGTGTDSIAIISGNGPLKHWFGSHTEAGETLANQYMAALRDSIQGEDK